MIAFEGVWREPGSITHTSACQMLDEKIIGDEHASAGKSQDLYQTLSQTVGDIGRGESDMDRSADGNLVAAGRWGSIRVSCGRTHPSSRHNASMTYFESLQPMERTHRFKPRLDAV